MDRIVKFEAAAGSGKTHQLTLEYLKRIFFLFQTHTVSAGQETGERLLGSILAITFTNKAANEMKERILRKLKKFALDHSGVSRTGEEGMMLSGLSRELNISPEKISRLSFDITEIIISHYNDFNVKTIDSLMGSIIQVISPDLNLPPDFEIGLEPGELAGEKARQFIERICRSDWGFMQAVLDNIKNSETLQGWLLDEKIVNRITGFYDMALSRVERGERHGQDVERNLYRCQRDLKKSLDDLLALIQDSGEGENPSKHLNRRLVNRSLLSAIQDFVASDKKLRKINPVISKSFFKVADPGSLLKKSSPESYRKSVLHAFSGARQRLSAFIFWLSLHRVRHFSQFLEDFVQFWERDRKKIFVNEFSKKIRDKLVSWEQSSLPYIYLKLSDRFRHFLFDEFQDTSELQFKALVPILEEVLISDEKSSLFIVGDRKQAIYRWRGGNAELMNEKRLREELGVLNFISAETFTRPLEENWRSGRPIIEFNNQFWNRENLGFMLAGIGCSEELIASVQNNFANVAQRFAGPRSREKGLVSIQACFREDAKAVNRVGDQDILYGKCLEIIGLLEKQGYRRSEMAILTRSNAEGRDLVRFLSEHGIPTLSDESLYLCSSKIIGEIIAFFRFINYPPDDLVFYTFLHGEIFQRGVEENFPGQMAHLDEQFLTDPSATAPLYVRFRERYPIVWETFLDPFVKRAGFSPPYDVFQDMAGHFKLYENFPESAPFLLSLGSILHELELKEINSLSHFIDEWTKNEKSDAPYAIDRSEDEKRLPILTIHKAKGLEFPVVLLPLLDKPVRGDSQIYWHGGDFYHLSKDFARINAELGDIYLREIQRTFIDELNLLYVAFTRARDALFVPLFTRPPGKKKERDVFRRFRDFSELIIHSPFIREKMTPCPPEGRDRAWVEFCVGSLPEKKDGPMGSVRGSGFLTPRSKTIPTADWKGEFLVFSPTTLFSSEEQRAMERGDAIHRILSQIYVIDSREDIVEILRPLVQAEGLESDELDCLEKFLKNDAILPFFQGDIEIYNEIEVAGKVGEKMEYRRIDRLIIKENEILVIDYKTGTQMGEEYIIQVAEYLEITAPLFPEKKVRGFLLFVDGARVEEIGC